MFCNIDCHYSTSVCKDKYFLDTNQELVFGFAGDVVEISDSEEEEVVILHPETPGKAPK